MKKITKVWLIVAACFVLIGCVVFAWGMSIYKWDFSKLSRYNYETNKYEISEKFDNISIKADAAEIIFEVSDNEKCKVECYEEKKTKHSVFVQDNTLTVEEKNNKRWYDYIGLNFDYQKITVYLPKTEYNSFVANEKTGNIKLPEELTFENVDVSVNTGVVDVFSDVSKNLKIQTSAGNINVANISVGTLELLVSTGDVTVSKVNCDDNISVGVTNGNTYLNDIICKNVVSSGDIGDISLNNVIASEKYSIKKNAGNVKFDRCDASEIYVETSTGDVKGSLLTDKIFIPKTTVGKIDVPDTTTGGKCEINATAGDIEIRID